MEKHNKYYWEEKQKRARDAETHTAQMASKYQFDIQSSINRSVVYGVGPGLYPTDLDYRVVAEDSVKAIMNYAYGKTAVLNFASFKNPGGMFIKGSRAQEESLCHESYLYNVLKELTSFYEWNQMHLNGGLYKDRLIYTPDVIFQRGAETKAIDVITCAAPNWSAAMYRKNIQENNEALESRIKLIYQAASANNVDTLILGAFGCGVFQQAPVTVAKYFHELAPMHINTNKHMDIIFAVPPALPGQIDNLAAFKKEFDA